MKSPTYFVICMISEEYLNPVIYYATVIMFYVNPITIEWVHRYAKVVGNNSLVFFHNTTTVNCNYINCEQNPQVFYSYLGIHFGYLFKIISSFVVHYQIKIKNVYFHFMLFHIYASKCQYFDYTHSEVYIMNEACVFFFIPLRLAKQIIQTFCFIFFLTICFVWEFVRQNVVKADVSSEFNYEFENFLVNTVAIY